MMFPLVLELAADRIPIAVICRVLKFSMRDNEDVRIALSGQTALGRVGDPSEIADAITALVSHELRWVTGERIEVSGVCCCDGNLAQSSARPGAPAPAW